MRTQLPPPITTDTPLPPSTPSLIPQSAHLITRTLYANSLVQNPVLSASLSSFINKGYDNASVYSSQLWNNTPIRFTRAAEIHEMLGPDGLIATVYNGDEPVASASVSKWHGDMDGVLAAGEEEAGWEIKAVTTAEGWGKMGLAGRCIQALTEELVRQEIEKGGNRVRLWLHTVEEVNGGYWRRRGWKDVRSFERPVGFWGSKFGFRLVVMVKDVHVD